MSIYKQTSGTGPDLVMIHGWGLHGGIWDNLVPMLEPHARVTRIDLPGHGRSEWSGEATLDDMVDAVSADVPDNAVWLGWSLGGLVAMRAAARRPAQVSALVTIASTPCFVRKTHWQSAMLPVLLNTFADELAMDYRRTLDRFLALQVRGSTNATTVLKSLREKLHTHGEPHPGGLRAGLGILADSDLRDGLSAIRCPTLLIAGERDSLVPLSAVQATRQMISQAQLVVVPEAGHAPFIAEPEKVASCVNTFMVEDRADAVM